ncbi:hypothetical protein SETIT_5G246500v2 [Setaria italica]|uniref:Protein CHUP1, chloroplastic n=1 Tax=Setaria italica TaxID=4555 RepID=K3XFM1_SETIT|nr:protein CHUP1, chloroplastic [Setaria italica]RCV26454.1 hypothetical protein SETIT_5G246500v2 [Setaria italica]
MVAGRVKAAMGFQRSPKSPAPEAASPSRTPTRAPSSGSAPSKASSLARSFGAYFPRSSAQVRPAAARAPPQVAELLRAIELLQEREARLRVELLEQKILKETVAIVPFLEAELAAKKTELERCRETADRLEAENARLCAELDAAALEVTSRKQRIVEMEKEMAELRRQHEAAAAADDCSSSASASNEHLESSSAAPHHASSAQPGAERPYIPPPPPAPPTPFKSKSYFSASSTPSPASSSPPSPSSSTSTSPSYSRSSSDTATAPRPRVPDLSKLPPIPPPPPPCPPPPPPPPRSTSKRSSPSGPPAASPPPPPPPPPPSRRPFGAAFPPACASGQCVRRVPEVVEFYHSLMRRESKRDGCAASEAANGGGVAAARDMIGEIENRSAHLLAIKSDVERQGDFIRFLIKEVEGAAFVDIEDVVSFVKWLDDELSRLVDERAVLKHFEWPEHKADALREAAFGYCDLKKLEGEAALFRDDARQPCAAALKKMQALFEKLEHGVYNLARVRDAATSRYTRFQIPWEWMKQDAGIVSQIKLQSVKLAMKYLKRVSSELEAIKGGPEEEELMLQGVRFAFRVHQFAGGFDVDTMRAFQELKEKASMCRIQRQKQSRHLRQHTLVART